MFWSAHPIKDVPFSDGSCGHLATVISVAATGTSVVGAA